MRQLTKILSAKWPLIILSTLVITASCQKETKNPSSSNETEATSARFDNNGNGFGNVSPEMVLRWNDAATYVVLRTLQL